MNDEQPELEPADEARVRALLADLGSPGSEDLRIPDDVADRLEATLAGLATEHAAEHASDERVATGTVVPLRPRWMPKLAGAAAAVIVLGLGGFVVTHLPGTDSQTSQRADAGSSAAGGGSAESKEAPRSSAESGYLPEVRSERFRADVRAAVGGSRLAARAQDREYRSPSATPPGPVDGLVQGCVEPRVADRFRVLPVTYDGRTAFLVVHPARQGQQRVDAVGCGGRRLASTTVPARD